MRSRNLLIALTGTALAAMLWGTATAQSPDKPGAIVVNNQATLVTFAGGTAKSGGLLRVRIDGPDGANVLDAASNTGLVDWVVSSGLPDGKYRYDVWHSQESTVKEGKPAGSDEEPDNATHSYKSGVFIMRGGMLEDWPVSEDGRDVELSKNGANAPSIIERIAGAMLEAMVPAAVAQDIQADGSSPDFILDDTDDINSNFYIGYESDGLGNSTGDIFTMDDDITNESAGIVTIDEGAPDNSLFIEVTGDIGLGTSTPAAPLHITDTSPVIRFDDTNDAQIWQLLGGGFGFRVNDVSASTVPFRIQAGAPDSAFSIGTSSNAGLMVDPFTSTNTMVLVRGEAANTFPFRVETTFGVQKFHVNANGGVNIGGGINTPPSDGLFVEGDTGLGTTLPDAPLHVRRTNGSAQVLVEDTGGTSPLQMFALRNNGSVRFSMANTTGNNWAFSTGSAGFSISKAGTGPEALVRNNGDLEISGTLMEGSSREIKGKIMEVDHDTVLAKLDRLPISEWNYTGHGEDRHIGPMAEDFHAVFGLGPDDKHIAPKDLAGVALAAAKALKQENEALRGELAALKATVAGIQGAPE